MYLRSSAISNSFQTCVYLSLCSLTYPYTSLYSFRTDSWISFFNQLTATIPISTRPCTFLYGQLTVVFCTSLYMYMYSSFTVSSTFLWSHLTFSCTSLFLSLESFNFFLYVSLQFYIRIVYLFSTVS